MNDNYFPDQEGNISVMQRVHKMWEFKLGYIPVPKFPIRCPICFKDDVQMSRCVWRPHEGSIKYRADMMVKCRTCSHAFPFGIPITREIYNIAGGKQTRHRWRELKKRIEEAENG